MIKYIIFDFDGTLVDSVDLFVTIIGDMADKYKLDKLNNDELDEFKALSTKDRIKKLNVPFYKLPLITVDAISKYGQYAASLKISQEIKEMLIELKKAGLKLFILSSNSTDNITKCLKSNGIECVDKVYSTRGLLDKSTVIKKFIKENKLIENKEEIIYVGDEHRDIESCRKTDIRIIAVTWGLDTLKFLEKGSPNYLVSEPSQIVDIIKTA